jgi:ketosteroid isomerase-like protein
MSDDEIQIRALIARWAKAVHAGDIAGVLADHSDDIVVFDVPPPNEVRGKEAYRDTWPPFFKFQKQSAVFEIDSLDVTAGAMSPARTRCSGADPTRSPRKVPTTALASPSGCARRADAGQSRTSITRSHSNCRNDLRTQWRWVIDAKAIGRSHT